MSAARTYYLFFALIHIGMGATVTAYTPFLQETVGLSLAEIGLVNTVFWAVLILSELPTGMLADGKSRAFSLKVGALFFGAGALAYTQATDFFSAAMAESLIGVGGAFVSGAGTAWIADALHREGRAEELSHVYATESLIKSVLLLLGGFVGVSISLVDPRLIWVPFAVSAPLAALVAHKLMNGQGEPLEYVGELMAFRLALRQLLRSRALLWVIAALMCFGPVIAFNHYWAIYFKAQVGQVGLAYIWPVIYLGLIAGAQLIRRLRVPQGSEANLIVLALVLTGSGLMITASVHGLWFSLPAVVLHEFGRGLFQPLTDSFVQHRVESSYRATFGSLQSFLGRMGFAIVPLVVWVFIVDKPNSQETIQSVWIICGSVITLSAVGLWFTRPRAR
ncbi:MAG: MFS transporter [Parcubacteria group bacterium]|nr:MFS transporter [Parcubacteria group bacterium]